MSVIKIEEYRQQNGDDILKVYTKPTKVFPNGGYFYAPDEAIDLVKERSWHLTKNNNGIIVTASKKILSFIFIKSYVNSTME